MMLWYQRLLEILRKSHAFSPALAQQDGFSVLHLIRHQIKDALGHLRWTERKNKHLFMRMLRL